nr:hypothetical protein [uncultured bacterium]
MAACRFSHRRIAIFIRRQCHISYHLRGRDVCRYTLSASNRQTSDRGATPRGIEHLRIMQNGRG